ncbi:MAG: hypothetical protein ABI968_09965 [Acidobacteriota bacterium]
MPAALTNAIYMECRLGEGAEGVDLVIRIEKDRLELLREVAATRSSSLRAHPAWKRLHAFCEEWADPHSGLGEALDHIWLEFDVPSGGAGAPAVPSVFARLHEHPNGASRHPSSERVHRVLRALLGSTLSDGLTQSLGRCMAALPDSAQPAYIGVMFSRCIDAARLCVTGLTDELLMRYLKHIRWPGPAAEVAAIASAVRRYSPSGATSLLHVDVGERIRPRLGLEYSLARLDQLKGRFGDEPLLQDFVERRLCTPVKRQGLLAWPGHSFESFEHELWESLLVRRVNHVKLVFESGFPLEAKAYLQFSHRFHARRGNLPQSGPLPESDDRGACACS